MKIKQNMQYIVWFTFESMEILSLGSYNIVLTFIILTNDFHSHNFYEI